MIRDITIGQYFPGNSYLHKLDPRAKIVITFIYIVALFLCKNFFSLLLLLTVSVAAVLISKISFRVILKGMKMILLIILFTAVLQVFYNDKGTVLWQPFSRWDFVITDSGVFSAVFLSVRIVALILFSSLLTYTTSPTMLTDAIERLLSPLKHLHVNVHALSMMMTIALRFIPTLIEELNIIISAQKARGADLDSGSLTKRAKALIPIFVPLFVSAFRRAYELAFAMECRCYNGDNGRTRMKVMKLCLRDYLGLLASIALTAAVIVTSYLDLGSLFLFESVI